MAASRDINISLSSLPSSAVVVISESTVTTYLGSDQHKDKDKGTDRRKDKGLDQHKDKGSGGGPGFVVLTPGSVSWSADTSARASPKTGASQKTGWETRARAGTNDTMVLTITMPPHANTTVIKSTTSPTPTTVVNRSRAPAATTTTTAAATTAIGTATSSFSRTAGSDGSAHARRNVVLMVTGRPPSILFHPLVSDYVFTSKMQQP